jgi:predicted transcriptional regulator
MAHAAIETQNDTAENSESSTRLLRLAPDLVSSYVSHNRVPSAEMGTVIRDFHASLSELVGRPLHPPHDLNPAISIKKSIEDGYITCLEDGKKLKMLKRYLRSHFQLTPAEYRTKWRLPRDYPMVAPAYARQRSALAKKNGLGTIPRGARQVTRHKV